MISFVINKTTKRAAIYKPEGISIHLEKVVYSIEDGILTIIGDEYTEEVAREEITDPEKLDEIEERYIQTRVTFWRKRSIRCVPAGCKYRFKRRYPLTFRATQWTIREYS